MNLSRILRLCCTGKAMLGRVFRKYSNRNMLKLHERGMYEDLFPRSCGTEMTDLMNKSPQCVYAGFDPTADSLHVGNLLILMNLLHWQRGGHQVIALLGGATGLLGDPSHRKAERQELKIEIAEENLTSIQENITRLFNNHQQYFWPEDEPPLKPLKIVNNLDFYKDLNVLQFIHSIGKQFRVGTMLGRNSVQERLKSPTGMSFAELTYQTFQAYDWLQLHKKYDCRFQIGGSDQMGNIMSGYDLITKSTKNQIYGLTLPLITAEGGKKFGKSVGNAVWLSGKKTSSYQLYQFMIRTTDADVEKFLKFFTFLPLPQIKQIVDSHKRHPEKREAQKKLAECVTLLVHGEEGLETAEKITNILYQNDIDAIASLQADEVIQMFEGAKVVDIVPEEGMTIYKLAQKAKCFKKDSDALQAIPAGGFHVNYQKITNINEIISQGIHVLPNNITLIRVGKRNYHIVRWM